MSFFQQESGSNLFIAATAPGDRGWVGYLLPDGTTPPGAGIELADALGKYGGSFVFSAQTPDLAAPGALQRFIAAVHAVLQPLPATRALVWLQDPTNIVKSTSPALGLSDAGDATQGAVQAPLTDTLSLQITSGAGLSLSETTLLIEGTNMISFVGGAAPAATAVNAGAIAFTGPARGAVQFSLYIGSASLHDQLNWGFQVVVPVAQPVRDAIGAWLPLALPGTNQIGFAVTIDPSDPQNAALPGRTFLGFTGLDFDQAETQITSAHGSTCGVPITLIPVAGSARLVIHRGTLASDGDHDFQLAPEGDFVIATSGPGLIGGLQGTEYLTFTPRGPGYAGDRLRFTSRQPAFAARYPFSEATPVGPPVDLGAPLLDSTYLTSWASLVSAPAAPAAPAYVAQPQGASLYGRDALVHPGNPALFGAREPRSSLPAEAVFPLFPYAAAIPGDGVASLDRARIEDLERQVVGPTRRARIAAAGAKPSAAGAPYNTTTPAGLLVTVGADGAFGKILLAQNLSPALRQLYFCQPDTALQQAFQTGQLFLVMANAAHLGQLAGAGSGACGGGPAFYNRMNIGEWELEADVGQDNRYDDYTNVVIVKGRQGPLYDPQSAASAKSSLVASPDKWTQKEAFASPSDGGGPPDPAELTQLSYWLQRYFADAAAQADTEYFAAFNRIARDPAWTGILFLRVKIAGVPRALAGITAGVASPDLFYAHHFGVEISQVANDPSAPDIDVKDSSSMFGLIHYVDPDFVPPAAGEDPAPVPPASGVDYDFRLLTLKVLFANTSVRSFQSFAQLTTNRLFGMRVTGMGPGGNAFNTIMLRGSYRDDHGTSVYDLRSDRDTSFQVDSNVVRQVAITTADMSTQRADGGGVVSWFGLCGFLDFAVVEARGGGAFDVFSFGSDDPTVPGTRRGLAFSNLGLRMSADQGGAPPQIVFDSDQIRFDLATSTPRAGSVFIDFALQLGGLVSGGADAGPQASGYLPVITDATLTGVDGGLWYGIAYRIDLGSPGALAGSVGLDATLVTAWSAKGASAGGYEAFVGIALPGTGGGAKLISLENVLKLSIGQIALTFDAGQKAFLFMFTEIALRFLGLLKIPPSGSTLFYLWGNAESGGQPSSLGWYAMYRKPSSQAPARRGEAL